MNWQVADRDAQRFMANRAELAERIGAALPADGVIQPLEGVFLARASVPLQKLHSVLKPSLCLIAQGSKMVLLGDHRYPYDPDHYLIATLELPRISYVLEASPEVPYLSFRLELDPALVNELMLEAGKAAPPPQPASGVIAMDVSPLDVDLQDAVLRLVRLVEAPEQAGVFLPLVKREIIHRLLMGSQGSRLRHMASQNGFSPVISRVIERIRENLEQPLGIEDLAREVGMSVSGLHHHFKTATAMSPMQYQKQLRLQEARRMMLRENLDAASTAYRLGFHDAAHFSREYKSLFGEPPMRDMQRLREASQTRAE